MFSLNFEMLKHSGREKATYKIMVITFIAVFITVVISSIVYHFCIICLFCYLLTIFLFLSIILSRKNLDMGVNSFYVLLILIVISFDFSGFFIHEIGSFLYMLPVTFSLLLLKVPRNYIYSLITLIIYSIRTLFFTEISLVEKIILVLIVWVGTFSIFYIKEWVMQLHKYKVNSLQKIHNASIKILGKVAEIKDEGTAYHLHRVELMVDLLCKSLRYESKYKNYINEKYIHDIRAAAYLHDIGKIGISDKILGKRGPLTDKEFDIIKSHTTIGYNILSDAKIEIGGESIYDLAMEIARHHHEKWDGNGYPHHLRGEDIPFSARLMAVVDVYDALVSRRPYKVPFPHSKALEIINEGSGTHFDPQIVDHFNNISDAIKEKIKPFLN